MYWLTERHDAEKHGLESRLSSPLTIVLWWVAGSVGGMLTRIKNPLLPTQVTERFDCPTFQQVVIYPMRAFTQYNAQSVGETALR